MAIIQDPHHGILLSGESPASGIRGLKRGDRVRVRGVLKWPPDRMWEVATASTERLGRAPEPAPYDLMVRGLQHRLRTLVRLSGTITAAEGPDGRRLVLRDRTGEAEIEINPSMFSSAPLLRRISEPVEAELVAIASRDLRPDGRIVSTLWPRDIADFTFAPEPPYGAILAWAAVALLAAATLYTVMWVRAMRRHAAALTRVTQELRESEIALRASESLYRSVTEAASDAILTIDDHCRVVFANHASATIFGWTPEEMRGMGFNALIPDACSGDCEGPCQLAGRRIEASAVHRDGRRTAIEISASAMGPGENRARATAVIRDVSARRRAEDEIRKMNEALRELSRELLHSQDAERRRIARELHDGTNQNLAALKMNLTLLQESCRSSDMTGRRLLGESLALVDQSSREVRSLSYLLHPPLIEELGLQSALQTFLGGFSERTGIKVAFFHSPPEPPRLSHVAELALFRIVQEALSNVQRHSGSKSAGIRLEWTDTEVELEIRDRGKGMESRESPMRMGVGLLGMRERAQQLGGSLDVISTPIGTTILVRLPLEGNAEARAECAAMA